MKKVIFAASALAVLTMSSVASAGEIEFLGQITDSTCNVALEGSSAATVTLPTISSSLFSMAGDTAGRTSFALLATNCTLTNGKTRVAAFFNGNSAGAGDPANVDSATGYLNNLAGVGFTPDASAAVGYLAAATNVKLRLVDGTSGATIRAGYTEQVTNAGFVTATGTAGSMTARLPYAVEYISTDASVGAGPVRSTVVYDLQYN